MMPIPNQVWLVVEPIDMRAGIDGLSQRLRLPQPATDPAQTSRLGWHRRLALPAPSASRALHLAPCRQPRRDADDDPMAVVDDRCRLAAS